MSEQSTPGPVKVRHDKHANEGRGESVIESVEKLGGPGIYELTIARSHSESYAERLALCWNACKGIDNDTLEAGAIVTSDKLFFMTKERDQLKAELDALLSIVWRAGMFIKVKGVELENHDDEDGANQFYILSDEILIAYDRIKAGQS